MRIVAVGDTHLYHDELVVPEGDVFVHVGDLCRGGDRDELAVCARWLAALPHHTKIVVAGNHDWLFQRHPAEARAILGDNVVYLQDAGATVGGVSFWGSPWQPEYNEWAFNLPRGAELAAKWALIPEGIDVLVTHGPPAGIGDRGPVPGRLGCADLRARVRATRPRLHIFGHVHQDGGFWKDEGTAFANVTTWSASPTSFRAGSCRVRRRVVMRVLRSQHSGKASRFSSCRTTSRSIGATMATEGS